MVYIIHVTASLLLVSAHGIFLGRGIYLLKSGKKPKVTDQIVKSLSNIMLPTAVISGLFLFFKNPYINIHALLGILPLVLIPVTTLIRLIIRKRKKMPWMLPLINYILILSAFFYALIF